MVSRVEGASVVSAHMVRQHPSAATVRQRQRSSVVKGRGKDRLVVREERDYNTLAAEGGPCGAAIQMAASRGERFSFFSSRRRHTTFDCDWSSDVCSSD